MLCCFVLKATCWKQTSPHLFPHLPAEGQHPLQEQNSPFFEASLFFGRFHLEPRRWMGVDVKSTEPLYSHKSVCTNPAAIGRLRQALQVPQLLKECCSWVDHYFQTLSVRVFNSTRRELLIFRSLSLSRRRTCLFSAQSGECLGRAQG